MLLEVFNHKRRPHISMPKTGNKEPILNWNKVTSVSLPFFVITWQWLSEFLAPVSRCAMYRLMSDLWGKLQIWMHLRGMFFKPPEQYQLLKWVQSIVTTRSVNNFKEDWKDGIVLCALIESISPGACPRYDVLHPKQENLNIELGLRLAESHLGLSSDLTVEEILNMDDRTASRLQIFVAELYSVHQLISGMNPKPCCLPLPHRTHELVWDKSVRDELTCFAKGMGLLMATKGRAANFNIYLQTYEFMDIVIEIKGRDNYDYCTERITLRSPRKKEFTNNPLNPEYFVPLTSGHIINIPLEYEIKPRKITVTYKPPSTGLYELSIISKGQHIFGSPFEVRVDSASSLDAGNKTSVKPLLDSLLSRQDSGEFGAATMHKQPSSFLKKLDTSPHGLVKIRRLVKTIVLREYAMIELKPGQPLSQDPRAWSALNTEPESLLNGRYEIPRVSLDKQICNGKIQHTLRVDTEDTNGESISDLATSTFVSEEVDNEHNAKQKEHDDSGKLDKENDAVAAGELNKKKGHVMESMASKLNPQKQQMETLQERSEENVNGKTHVEEDKQMDSNETNHHKKFRVALKYTEDRQNSRFRYNDASQSKTILVQSASDNDQHAKMSPSASRQEPEGLEGKGNGNDNYLETAKSRWNNQAAPEISIIPIVQPRNGILSSNSKIGQSSTTGLTPSRVPEKLVNEWANLWTQTGESIVKVRVKEWENIPKCKLST